MINRLNINIKLKWSIKKIKNEQLEEDKIELK